VRVAAVCLVGCAFSPSSQAPIDAARDAAAKLDAMIDAPPDALPGDLIAYYPMDSLPMIDATGHGHDGSCSACPTLGSGVLGSAYAFANERVDVQSGSDLRSESGTAVAWLAFDALPTSYACPFGVVYDQPSNGNTWQLCRNAAEWSVFLETEGSGMVEIDDVQPIEAGDWHYVAIVWTPTQCTFYVDAQVAAGSAIGALIYDPTGSFTFGADIRANGSNGVIDVPITGRLDEMKIFNRDLSQIELAAMMQEY
jgi:Concanavalin A-like lectin/glucanases superfamily